jgi:hypothetical protein
MRQDKVDRLGGQTVEVDYEHGDRSLQSVLNYSTLQVSGLALHRLQRGIAL